VAATENATVAATENATVTATENATVTATEVVVENEPTGINPLQRLINDARNNSVLILPETTYIVNNTIIIRNKSNISIGPLEGQTILDGHGIENLLLIDNSNSITISKLNLNNSKIGILIINSNFTEIDNNVINLSRVGVSIISGKNNTIMRNRIYNASDSCEDGDVCVGVDLTHTRNNNIIDNIIYSGNLTGLICHCFVNDSCNRNNKIQFRELSPKLLIGQGECFSRWNATLNAFSSCDVDDGSFCILHDRDDDPLIWMPLC